MKRAKKHRVNVTIEKAIHASATKFAHDHYEVGTFSHMVALALLAMMEKAAKR